MKNQIKIKDQIKTKQCQSMPNNEHQTRSMSMSIIIKQTISIMSNDEHQSTSRKTKQAMSINHISQRHVDQCHQNTISVNQNQSMNINQISQQFKQTQSSRCISANQIQSSNSEISAKQIQFKQKKTNQIVQITINIIKNCSTLIAINKHNQLTQLSARQSNTIINEHSRVHQSMSSNLN